MFFVRTSFSGKPALTINLDSVLTTASSLSLPAFNKPLPSSVLRISSASSSAWSVYFDIIVRVIRVMGARDYPIDPGQNPVFSSHTGFLGQQLA